MKLKRRLRKTAERTETPNNQRTQLTKARHGIQTRMLFAGNLTKHPCFNEMRSNGKGYRIISDLNNTNRIMEDTFWVGVYPGMTDEMIDQMIKGIKEAVES